MVGVVSLRTVLAGVRLFPTGRMLSVVPATLSSMTSRGHAAATFEVTGFTPVEIGTELVPTAMESGVAVIEKRFTGAVAGRSTALFSSSRDVGSGAATYAAIEAFEGTLDGRSGSFNFLHIASTHGEDRYGEVFSVVEQSGTGDLAGLTGSGGMAVDPDGTHRIWFDYDVG